MKTAISLKKIVLLLGDVLALYVSLLLMLYLRYGGDFVNQLRDSHLLPFSILFSFWLIIFYIVGAYEFHRPQSSLEFSSTLVAALGANFALAILFFYFLPAFGIAPKTNLFLFMLIFAVVEVAWRKYFKLLAVWWPPVRLALLGKSPAALEVEYFLTATPQFGYRVVTRIADEKDFLAHKDDLREVLRRENVEAIIVPRQLRHKSGFAKNFMELLNSGLEVVDLAEFYEAVFRRVPLEEIEEGWFLENVPRRRFYEAIKNFTEFILAILLTIILSPLALLLAILVKISSPGPVVYSQARVGRYGREFMLRKFRSMVLDAERGGPQWSAVRDERSTAIGQILRLTHLDEVFQLTNILQGELAFVGPRPERPEIASKLREQISYYETRSLIKPGLTGWAQINHRKDAAVEDVKLKLQYDLYYLKNRSFVLDMAILLKTLRMFFINPQ
ncbi:MAG: exopolysaccharide biosynthesis polyprenyl glycosylphosphotransferase [Patescibacteria group bacterium]